MGTVKSQMQKSKKRLPTSTCGKGFYKSFVANVSDLMLALLAMGFFPENAGRFLRFRFDGTMCVVPNVAPKYIAHYAPPIAKRPMPIPIYQEHGKTYEADTCGPVEEAAQAGLQHHEALVHGPYPDRQLPP